MNVEYVNKNKSKSSVLIKTTYLASMDNKIFVEISEDFFHSELNPATQRVTGGVYEYYKKISEYG